MKTKLLLSLFLFYFCFFLTSPLIAQVKPKFGKIDKAELEMNSFAQDTAAHAVVLFDIGNVNFVFDRVGDNGFQIHLDRHVRIKILDQNGFDWGDVEIAMFEQGAAKERVANIKGMTYNIQDGNVEKIKLTNKDIFTEQIDKNRSRKKFALPGIKEGSIIEYRYTLVSDFLYKLDDWIFQSSVPVQWSEYKAVIPDYFYYNKTFKGYEFGEMVINESSTQSDAIDFGGGERMDYVANVYHWGYKNIPAFKLEAYSTTPKNYVARVEFELSSINVPGQLSKNYNETWEGINTQLMTSEDFGGQLNKVGLVKEDTERLIASLETPAERIGAIYEYVKGSMAWNGEYRMFLSGNMRKVCKERKGNSADINFVLINMLKAADLEAYPLLVSTRTNGFINFAHPSMSQFNHVIAAVVLDGQYLLLDAAHNLLPAHVLHPNNLNDRGRLIHPQAQASQWITLNAGAKYKEVTQATLKLTDEGVLEGTIKNLYRDYAAYVFRSRYQGADSEEDFVAEFQSNNEGLEISNHSFENLDDIYKRVTCSYDVVINEKAIDAGDLLYFSPMLFYATEENPFKLEERKYPVDYSYPIEKTFAFQISLPDGYAVEELPEGVNMALPEKGAQFSYSVDVKNDNTLHVTSRLKINKSIFISDEYAALKEFYNIMVDQHAAQVVLRKKT